MIDFAPGMRTIIRDEEWMVKKIGVCESFSVNQTFYDNFWLKHLHYSLYIIFSCYLLITFYSMHVKQQRLEPLLQAD